MAKIAELFVEIGAKIDKFEKGMSDVQKGMVKTGQKFDKIGKSLTRNVTLPIVAVGVASVKAFADFDKAMTESLAIMGNVSDSMQEKMSDVAKTISEETTFSAKELAEAYFFLASAGMDAEQSVAALGDVAKFAQAGAFDLATATDLLTDALTALGMSSKDAAINQENLIALSDALVKANTLANASVQQFSEALTNRAAAALVNVNKKMNEGIAVLAAFADKGIKGQVAGMRLSMMLTNLGTAALKNNDAFKKFNVTVFDSEGNMRNVADIIGDLEKALGGLPAKQKAAALAQMGFNDRARQSILTLMGSSEKIRQWEKDLKKAGGTTDKVAKNQMKAFANQMKLVWNSIVNLAASIGEQLGPALLDIVKAMKPLIKFAAGLVKEFSKLPGPVKTIVMGFVGLVAAAGPALMIFGKFLIILPKLKLMFIALKAAALAMSGPFGIVVIAALALGAALNGLINKYKAKQDAEMAAIVKSGTVVSNAMKLRKKLIENEILTVKEWSEIYNKHGRNHGRVLNAIAKNPAYEQIRKKLKAIQEEEKKTGEETGNLGDDFEELGDTITTTALPAMNDLRGVVYNMQETLEDADFKTPFDNMIEGIYKARDVAVIAGGEITKSQQQIADEAESAAERALAAWEEQYGHLITLVENMGGAFGNFAEGILDKSSTLKENLQTLWDDILGSFRRMIGDMVAEWATNFLKQTLLDLTTKTAKEAGESITSNLGGAVSDAGKAAVSLAKGIGGAIVSLAQAIVSAAKIIASGAGALLKAAAVLLAIYGAFKIINKLFGKTGGGGAAEYTNKILLTMRDHIGAQSEKMDETNRLLAGFYGKIDTMLNELYKIRDATKGILTALTSQGTVYVDVFRSRVFEGVGDKIGAGLADVAGEIGQLDLSVNVEAPDLGSISRALGDIQGKIGTRIPEFQTGGFVPRDTLAKLHAGETVVPKGGMAGPTVILNISTMDAIGVRDFMRRRGLPEIIEAIKTKGTARTLMKEALKI